MMPQSYTEPNWFNNIKYKLIIISTTLPSSEMPRQNNGRNLIGGNGYLPYLLLTRWKEGYFRLTTSLHYYMKPLKPQPAILLRHHFNVIRVILIPQ